MVAVVTAGGLDHLAVRAVDARLGADPRLIVLTEALGVAVPGTETGFLVRDLGRLAGRDGGGRQGEDEGGEAPEDIGAIVDAAGGNIGLSVFSAAIAAASTSIQPTLPMPTTKVTSISAQQHPTQ